MYKVMIVDDEMLVRIGIRSLLDWGERGFEIVAEAGNGEVAYEKYLALKPDVVITDIKMPKKDGLWLTDKIKEIDPKTEIVFLTCYDDFEYARAALQKKVSSYILKAEMEEEELEQILDSIKKKLDSTNHSSSKESGNASHLDMRSKEEQLLAYVLDIRKTMEEVKDEFDTYHVPWENKKYVFLQFDFNASLKEQIYDKEKIANIIAACKELILNKLNTQEAKCIGKQFGKSITCLLFSKELTEFHLKGDLEYIKDSILQYFNIKCKSLNSNVAESLEDIRNEVAWIFEASNALFYIRQGEHRTKEQLSCSVKEKKKFDLQEYTRELCNCIEENRPEILEKLCLKLQKDMSGIPMNSFDAKFNTAQLITNVMNRFEYCMNDDGRQNMTYQKDIMDIEDMGELMNALKEFGEIMLRLITEMKLDNAELLIERAIGYIKDNYKDKISLEDVAGHIGISKYYLSYLFNKDKDINFSTYINKIRIEKAKELLKQPQMTINQVYNEVGFNDQQYFSKIFKKYVGMTVTEYRSK